MIGTTLQNRYRLDAELGRGGMGVIYRAHDTLLDRGVAVKVLSDAKLGSQGRARLLREAQAAARLNHPNIVSIHDAGETDGVPFIVMELVEGESLFDRPPPSLDEMLAIVRQMCAALEHAHAHGIVHRDLKPENVLIAPDGTAKLMDFGLARSDASRISTEGALIGTVFYLAPEQALGRPVDGRADLYALGVMLYELTTGRLPFEADDPLIVVSQHLHAPVEPPRSHRADLPPALEAIILKLLAKRPDDRFASAREVAQALADMTQPAAPNPRHNLPVQLTSFIGREKEIAEVKRLLASSPGDSSRERGRGGAAGEGVRLLTLTGSGGTGKTRLALQAAVDLLDVYGDGIWLVELASLADPDLVPPTIAAVLGVREEPTYPLLKTLADYLRPRSTLLIFDNCEHLIDACAQLIEALLRGCPDVRIIATSREALGIPGETTFRVPSLSLPDIRRLPPSETLAGYESIRLFVDRAAAVRPEFRLTEANAPALAQICHRLDGVPLAIELAAARVRAMTVEQIAARLDDRFRLLTGGSRTALPRQQTLRALIDWSWDLLPDAERTLLRRLAVFLNGWMLEAAEAVAAGGSVQPDDVIHLLARLIEKSLVMADEQGEATRYSLLETIRQYARDQLLASGEAESTRSRHLSFFLRLAEEAEPRLRSADQLIWLARLETEHDNLRAALKWARGSRDFESGLRLAGSLSRFWYLRGYWNEGREWLRLLLAESPADAPLPEAMARARARALLGAGWLCDDDGNEIPLYSEALALCRQVGDRWGEAYALRGMVAGLSNWGDQDRVLPDLQHSLDLFREVGDAWGIGLALYNLGWLRLGQDDNQQAEACWQAALENFRQSGDRWGTAVALNALGYVDRMQGNYPRAMTLTRESLALFRQVGDKAGIAVSLSRLGNVAFRRGEYAEATALLEESLNLQRDRGDQQGIVSSLHLLGLVAGYQGHHARASAALEEALTLTHQSGDQYNRAYGLDCLALVHYLQGDIDRAAAMWPEALTLHGEYEDKDGQAFARYGLGLAALRRGDQVQAYRQLTDSLGLYRASGDRRYVALLLHCLGLLARAQGDRRAALAHFYEGLKLRKKMGARRGIAESLEGIAGTIDPDRVSAVLFGAASALRETIGAPLPPVERDEHDRHVAAVRDQLGEAVFNAAWAEGRAMPIEQAIKYALELANG